MSAATFQNALPAALSGRRFEWAGPVGKLSMYVEGSGPPLLLIHSVNAAASAAEVRPLHRHGITGRQVFSVDLPGYGFSARDDLPYSPRMMTDAIHSAVGEILRLSGQPSVDALALSLSSEFLARAAVEQPTTIRSVALVSPTGFKSGVERRGLPGSTLGMNWLSAILRGPGWGGAIFRLLTRPGVIRYFLNRTWGSKEIDEELWRYDVQTARQQGAEYAPLRFLSGYLFSRDINTVYDCLTQPVWLSHGVRGDFTDYGNLKLIAGRSNWHCTSYPTGALPHFEMTRQFCADYEAFLQTTSL